VRRTSAKGAGDPHPRTRGKGERAWEKEGGAREGGGVDRRRHALCQRHGRRRPCGCLTSRATAAFARASGYPVSVRLYGALVHFVAHPLFQEMHSLTSATFCPLLDRDPANEVRCFRTFARSWFRVPPQRSRSPQSYGRGGPYNWDARNHFLTLRTYGPRHVTDQSAVKRSF